MNSARIWKRWTRASRVPSKMSRYSTQTSRTSMNIQIPKLKNMKNRPIFSMSGRLVSQNVDDFELPFQDNVK